MDGIVALKYRPFSADKEFTNLQRQGSDVFEVVVKPVSSPNRLKIYVIVGTVVVIIGIIAAVVVATTLSATNAAAVNKQNPQLQGTGNDLPSSTTTNDGRVETTADPTATSQTSRQTSVYGVWTTWAGWTACDVTCGGGTRSRTRVCQKASSSDLDCIGSSSESQTCSTWRCPVYGVWTTWAGWTACDVTCGGGTRSRTRVCQKASSSDLDCIGSSSESQTCNTRSCPVYGVWTTWAGWTACDVTCGGGTRSRTRVCQKASSSDLDCIGSSSESQTCNTRSCPVYGVWTTWAGWRACDVTCGGGTRSRTRVCQKASSSDLDCIGSSSESQTCNTRSCPVYGVWTTWAGWTACDVTCGGGTRSRTRVCQQASSSDLDCIGSSSESQTCSTWSCPGDDLTSFPTTNDGRVETTADPTARSQTSRQTSVEPTADVTSRLVTTTQTTKSNWIWNNWGAWTSCGATCGTGYHTRYRTCLRATNSDPICQGEYVQTTTCSLPTCPVYGVWTTWAGWKACDVTCGGGTRSRTRVCQKTSSSDLDCVGSSSHSETCNTWICPDCSQTCTTGSLNADCTACECTSNTVQGLVRNHANVPLKEASIAHASVPYKRLATTNETGGFILETTCDAVEIVITRSGYADVTVTVTGNTVKVQMSLIVYPAISMDPRSRVRVQGENVTFCCEAYGNPAISSYEWMKDGVLIDDSKYPDGFNLTLNDVTTSDSGEYKCRANSPVGAVYSSPALLSVKAIQSEFCEDAYEERKISLPSDCVQADSTTLYEVGGCAKKTCRGDSNEDGLCGPSKKFCCLPSSEEERTVQCSGYTLKVLIITGCSCGQCSSGDITIQGQANGLNSGIALRLGTVYVNGSSVARTTFSGLFSFTVPAGTLHVAITLEDTLLQHSTDNYKTDNIRRVYGRYCVPENNVTGSCNSSKYFSNVENTISMGNNSGMPAVAEVIIPPNSFVDAYGNPYNGVVKASVNMFDPRNLSSISVAPGSFEFTDAEGETQNLQTFGVIVMEFNDESGNKLNGAGNVTVNLDSTLVESTYSGNVIDVKLWGLSEVTGRWEEVGSMAVDTSKRRRRQTAANYIVGTLPISAYRAINLDCYAGFRRCYYNMVVTDTNNNPVNGYTVRIIHMTYPGERYSGSTSKYVTAVKEIASSSRYAHHTFCRKDSWGYIQAYKGDIKYSPGNSSSSGLSSSAISRLDYQTTADPISIKSKFLLSSDGPFYYSSNSLSSPATQNHFRFYERHTSFSEFTLFDEAPLDAHSMSLSGKDHGPMLWYPYKFAERMEDFKICMIKILAIGQTSGLSFSVKSKAGMNSGIKDTILGVRQVAVENGGACVEYKCSGVYPLFKSMTTNGPRMQNDKTKITITPLGRLCTVSWEGDIKHLNENSGSSNVGSVSHEWVIPETEEHGIYIYEQSGKYQDFMGGKARSIVLDMCKAGKNDPPNTLNPPLNSDGPALRYTCI
ncbi:LOW QUALITY PROTEIN: cartilage intermediate layer protein 2-like [Pecten maximus]|uniref:LOW QUALITY PROTEIN: cartilage intermediate layer protein 2-like n=1 Tax=Pecten maximus TaxID=6579 RepID=UPI00145839F1|nr:LOW QUALITY PROTEIN: cartilage intermediate layer protein 2-like [Pecten maximus]